MNLTKKINIKYRIDNLDNKTEYNPQSNKDKLKNIIWKFEWVAPDEEWNQMQKEIMKLDNLRKQEIKKFIKEEITPLLNELKNNIENYKLYEPFLTKIEELKIKIKKMKEKHKNTKEKNTTKIITASCQIALLKQALKSINKT